MFKNQIKFIKKKDTLNSTYDEGKSVIAERFINTLKAKIYKKMTANGWGILHWLRNLRQIIKFLILKVNDRVTITKYMNIFNNSYIKNWSKEIFIINFDLKTNPWIYKTKHLNGEKIIGGFIKKQ